MLEAGNNSIAIGQSGEGSPKVIASGVNSIAIGMQSQATGESAIAEGPGSRCRRQIWRCIRSLHLKQMLKLQLR